MHSFKFGGLEDLILCSPFLREAVFTLTNGIYFPMFIITNIL
jgi:hypothetical protein